MEKREGKGGGGEAKKRRQIKEGDGTRSLPPSFPLQTFTLPEREESSALLLRRGRGRRSGGEVADVCQPWASISREAE